MGVLIDGVWRDEELPAEVGRSGEFRRADSRFRERITADGSSGIKAEAGRYHLYVAHGCPWAHRTLIYRAFKKLEKEMCRIKISVRSNVAKAEGLTESMINDLFDYSGSQKFNAREKAALHYAELFKQGEHAIDKDAVYVELANHFSDEEIIELGLFCAEVDGVGKFVKSLNVLSWEEACELNPKLGTALPPRVAAE